MQYFFYCSETIIVVMCPISSKWNLHIIMMLTTGRTEAEVKARIGNVQTPFMALGKACKSKDISLRTKLFIAVKPENITALHENDSIFL